MNLSSSLALIAVVPSTMVAAARTQLSILHINDHHSHLTEESAGYINIVGDDIPSAVSANTTSK